MIKKAQTLACTGIMLLALASPTWAVGESVPVTKRTQQMQGLVFTLSAVRVSDTAVMVHLEIPLGGKLADLKSVRLEIGNGSGSPEVSAPLQTTTAKNGSRVVSFQIAPTLADKCAIVLLTPNPQPLTHTDYTVQIKGYITAGK